MNERIASRVILLAVALFSAFVPGLAAQDAKTLYEQAQTATDRCKKVALVCQAADANKKYKDDCTNSKSSLIASDQGNLRRAQDALAAGTLPTATVNANRVCRESGDLYTQAQDVLKQISAKQTVADTPKAAPVTPADESPKFYRAARDAFDRGDFAAASSNAAQVSSPDLKPLAAEITHNIAAYNQAVQEGVSKERSDSTLDEAIAAYSRALQISRNGGGVSQEKLSQLQARKSALAAAHPSSQPASGAGITPGRPSVAGVQNAAKPLQEDPAVKLKRLLDEADHAEQAGNLTVALRAFAEAQGVDRSNPVAEQGIKRVKNKINSDPAEQAKTLALAIRNFYSFQYADCEYGLTTYLSSPTAKSRGAALFYLGATRFYRDVLESSKKPEDEIRSGQVQQPFKDARATGYKPVERFVSPLLMRAWKLSGGAGPSAP